MANDTTYSDEDAARALAVLASVQGNVKKTSRITGIPRTTIQGWAGKNTHGRSHPKVVPAEVVQDERLKLAEKWERTVSRALDRADLDAVLNEAKYKDLVIGAGIGTEKVELLRGRPTSRSHELKISLIAPGSLKELAAHVLNGDMPALPARTDTAHSVPTHDIGRDSPPD